MAARKFLNGINMVGTAIINVLLHPIAGDVSSPADGEVWYNSTSHKFRGRSNGGNVTFVNDGGDLSAASVAISAVNGFDTQVRTSRLDQMAAPTADVSMNSHKITGVTDPTSAQDAATKAYVDATAQGFTWKQPVRVASVANINLTTGLVAGQTIDGVTLAAGDRVLAKDQTTATQMGIYVATASGAASRSADADSSAELVGAAVFVSEGSVNADSQWNMTTNGPITIGTTNMAWAQVGGGTGVTGGNGLTLTGSTLDVGAGTGITVDAANVNVDTSVVMRGSSGLIGNNSATSISYNHGLGTYKLTVAVWDASTHELVDCGVIADVDNNHVTLNFDVAPGTNAYQVVVAGIV